MKKIFYIMVLNMIFASCTYHCPGYDINDKNQIPFRLGDSVMYVSNLNDTAIFDVDDFYAEGPNSWKGFAMDVDCRPECYYHMTSGSNLQLTIKERQTWSMEIRFGEDRPYSQVVYHLPSGNVNSHYEFETFVNKPDYVTTVNDLSGKRRVSSFVKAPFRGIIEFKDKQTGLTWTQIETERK
jgi:hypothetical protein